MVAVSYPGVYIQEVPSGSRAIAGVPTAVGAFVGYTARGAVHDPVQMFSFADFERNFGGLHPDSALSYTLNHFFLNGGATAWVVRVATGALAASVTMQAPGPAPTLTATAQSEGQWGNALVLGVDYATSNPASTFNLTVTELVERNGRLVTARTEAHRNLSMNSFSGNYALDAVSASSDLVELTNLGAPMLANGEARSAPLTNAVAALLDDDHRRLAISLDGGAPYEFDLFAQGGAGPADLAAIALAIDIAVPFLEPGTPAFDGFGCVVDNGQLLCTSGSVGERSSVTFTAASINSATQILGLGLVNGGREADGSAAARPATTGTAGDRIGDFAALAIPDPGVITATVTDGGGSTTVEALTIQNTALVPPLPLITSAEEARLRIEQAMRATDVAALSTARVELVDQAIVITPGGTDSAQTIAFTGAAADELLLSNAQGAQVNVGAYQLGVGPTSGFQISGTAGNDGTPPTDVEIIGARGAKSGMFALEDVSDMNLLNLPAVSDPGALAPAIAYAEERRSMFLIDMPAAVDNFEEAREWINDPANAGLRHRNATVAFPYVRMADPLQNNRLRSFPNSGVLAGLYSRTDAQRGVWKAPAGIDARLTGVQALDYVLGDQENGVLNPLGLNCLRTFPVYGSVSWGARTMVGADALTSEWKYIPVRRTALFIEESLYRGTQFVVFEPNDEPLWAQIRLSVGSFMHNMFRQGAFQGTTPQEAYLVRCDSTTTTQADIDLGIVNILVGFAPLKPAEFVVIQIQQMAGNGPT